MKKIMFVFACASPHTVKFSKVLASRLEPRFLFYEELGEQRAAWWKMELAPYCRVLGKSLFKWRGKYVSLDLVQEIAEFDPDVLVLGSMSIPSNYFAYRWAKRRGKRVFVFTERSRTRDGVLRRRSPVWSLLRILYRGLDGVIVSSEDALPQYRDEFGFGDKVRVGWYPADLEAYYAHKVREKKAAYTFLFPNRATEIYGPLLALDIFHAVSKKHPGSRLLMNAQGELIGECRKKIEELGLGDKVSFITGIKSWDDLHRVYEGSDIMILPASFSNGNFTILEAMASGMGIVISNRVMGFSERIKDGVNGFNCEPSVEAFVERIERYIAEPGLFKLHAQLSREKAYPHSLAGTADYYVNLVENG